MAKTNHQKRWEYNSFICSSFGEKTVKKLNSLGKEGWEAVSVTLSNNGLYQLLFKRGK